MTSRIQSSQQIRASFYLVIVGVCAALHIWKLPPALPALRQELGMGLVESGFLLSMVQVAGMLLGLLVGLMAERIGLRRCIMGGLGILAAASLLAIKLDTLEMLMALRALEGCGFLMVAMPVPTLIRRLVPPSMLSRIMGLWSCYIPIGTIIILIFGAWLVSVSTWRVLWLVLAAVTLGVLGLTRVVVPPDPPRSSGSIATGQPPAGRPTARQMVRDTLCAGPVWLVALTFGMYSAQWIAIVGFLPTIYTSAGIAGTTAGVLTGLVAGANIVGNLLAGQLLHRDAAPRNLLIAGFVTMMACAYMAFGFGLSPTGQFIAVVMLSAIGGLIPATMFVLALAAAPTPHTTTTSVGLMQQGSSMGQFCGPPIVAYVASLAGGWQSTWLATGAFSTIGIVLAIRIHRAVSTGQTSAKRSRS